MLVSPVPHKPPTPSTSTASATYRTLHEVFQEETYSKPNGTFVFVTDKLPARYKREIISDEEIDYIMVRNLHL